MRLIEITFDSLHGINIWLPNSIGPFQPLFYMIKWLILLTTFLLNILPLILFLKLILERREGVERETSIYCPTYSCIYWLILVFFS